MRKVLSIVLIICSINFSLYGQEKSREVINTGEEEEINNKRTILDDSTFNVYSAKTTLFLQESNLIDEDYSFKYLDTTLYNFELFDITEKYNVKYQNLGILGTALFDLEYTKPNYIKTLSGFNAYSPYYENYKKIKFYDTKSPFIDLNLIFGGLGRSKVDFSFSRSINKNWNLGFDVHRITSDKQIGATKSKGDRNVLSSSFDLYVYHNSKNDKYKFLTSYFNLNHNLYETGGMFIENDDLPINFFQYQDSKVNLIDVENHNKFRNFHTYHEYSLNDNLKIYYLFDYLNYNNEYIDQNLSQNLNFYDKILIDSTQTLDTFNIKTFENNIGLKGKFKSIYYNIFLKRYDLSYSYLITSLKTKKNEYILGSKIEFNKNSFLFNIDAFIKDNGNYNLSGKINSKYFEGNYFSGLFDPTILENYFTGNHNFWNENFNSKFINQIDFKLKLSNDFINFYPDIKLSSIKNYVYFDQKRLPKQNQNTIYKNTFSLSFDVNFLKSLFHLESKLSYTNLAGNNVNDFLRLPKFKYFGKLYYSDIWFDKKIPIELGTNLYFRSSYFANAFSPDIQQFYIQNHFKLKSYFLSNIYFSMKIENLRVFLKMHHFNQFEKLDGYFVTPYYPGQRRVLDFGIRWLFFN